MLRVSPGRSPTGCFPAKATIRIQHKLAERLSASGAHKRTRKLTLRHIKVECRFFVASLIPAGVRQSNIPIAIAG
jgi:hypothetical protein